MGNQVPRCFFNETPCSFFHHKYVILLLHLYSFLRCRKRLGRRRRRRRMRLSADASSRSSSRSRSRSRSRRAATSRMDRLWDYGVIPYEIDSNFSGNVTNHAVPITATVHFLLRDADMHSAYLLRQRVRPSVRPSQPVLCLND